MIKPHIHLSLHIWYLSILYLFCGEYITVLYLCVMYLCR